MSKNLPIWLRMRNFLAHLGYPDFPAILYFPATPKIMNQNSPLLTSQTKLKHTSVINVRIFPIFVKQEELISRAGSFCGFGQVGAKLAGNWIRWRSKSRAESFLNGNSRKIIESTHLCLEFFDASLKLLASRLFEAIRVDFLGLK
jgi:hypothetical protein